MCHRQDRTKSSAKGELCLLLFFCMSPFTFRRGAFFFIYTFCLVSWPLKAQLEKLETVIQRGDVPIRLALDDMYTHGHTHAKIVCLL